MARPRLRRKQPKRLAGKLLAIRNGLGLSQTEIARRLDLDTAYTVISAYERGTREPDLITLLGYARLAGATVDVLIDDKASLPK
ncbi:MAG: Helix-turn-helix domain [Blastocatellia bacterium]|jgi:transcriptional regulator with XRE-family HTH domain|nr:Helix-turn-helix domain [Blastocatellia bacterium]